MPTEIPFQRHLSTNSTTDGTLAFAIAVLLMLAISAVVLLHPVGDRSADSDALVQAQKL